MNLLPHPKEASSFLERRSGKDEKFSSPTCLSAGKSTLTDAEFEEIVQIVLRKSFQECLGMGFSER